MNTRLIFAAAVLMMTCCVLCTSCAKEAEAAGKDLTQAVSITAPQKKKFSRTFDTASVAMAAQAAYINPKVAAVIKSFAVKEGDPVKAGAVLARLDGSDYEIAVNAARAQIAAAEAGVMQAEAAFAKISADYERFKTLKQNGSVSASEFEQVEAGYKQTEAGLAAAKAQRGMAQSALEGNLKQLGYTAIVAPFTGYVAARNGEIGEMAAPASPRPMFEIVQSDTLKINVFVSELEIGGITGKTEAKVFFDAFPDKETTAKVSLINSKVDPMTKSIKVELTLDNRDHFYKPGMTVRVRFTLPEREYLVIPRNAVFTRDNEAGIVYVKNGEDRVFTKEIFMGGTVEGYTIVEKGLAGNEDIVVGGGRRLEEGQKVTVIAPQELQK
ncbi:MAG TPA: efflux RND transporter periplasmic adaptor subunit [bacterium]|nr:efflux RND transporter periplasmic adaptor subunit [bacterium]